MRDKCPEHVLRRRGCPICERISAALAESALDAPKREVSCEGKPPVAGSATGSAIASRESVALLQLLTCASLMRLTIKERATFLTKTTDWERLEDAMRAAENVLGDYTQNKE